MAEKGGSSRSHTAQIGQVIGDLEGCQRSCTGILEPRYCHKLERLKQPNATATSELVASAADQDPHTEDQGEATAAAVELRGISRASLPKATATLTAWPRRFSSTR